jgi:hypothetical protein
MLVMVGGATPLCAPLEIRMPRPPFSVMAFCVIVFHFVVVPSTLMPHHWCPKIWLSGPIVFP